MKLINEVQFVKINDEKYVMLNLINAAADIIDLKTYNDLANNNFENINKEILLKLKKRKYLFDNDSDYRNFLECLNKKIDKSEKASVPCFLIIPTYACNLKCTYCYERTYDINSINIGNLQEIIDIQFNVIDNVINDYKKDNRNFNCKDVRITIMGGEPLLKHNKNIIEYIFNKIKERNYSVDIVTNGVNLDSFIDLLSQDCLDHIQITLDGSKETHDKRRIYADGKGSFDKIIKNIDRALKNNIDIYLRVNVDNENINDLPNLANILIDKFGCDKHLKPYIYLLQDGGCSGDANVIREEVGIEKIYDLEYKYPQMKIFRKKFHIESFINAIFQNTRFTPKLRHCGAAINQYILDYKGNIYRCWHGIGNDNYSTGKFMPDVVNNKEKNKQWDDRSVLNIEKCRRCNYRYICGTGCPATAHKDNDVFDISKESCVDYKKLIEIIIKENIKF